jgi:hypothetical protein
MKADIERALRGEAPQLKRSGMFASWKDWTFLIGDLIGVRYFPIGLK